MLTPEQTLNLYPQLDHIQGDIRDTIIQAMNKYKTPFIPGPTPNDVALMNQIALHASREMRVSIQMMKSTTRLRAVVDARALFMAVGFQRSTISLRRLAMYLNRTHATGLHLLKNVAMQKEVADHIPKVIKLL